MSYIFRLNNNELTHDLFVCPCNAEADCENCYGKGIIAIEVPEFSFECSDKDADNLLKIIKQPQEFIVGVPQMIKSSLSMIDELDLEISEQWRRDNNFHYGSDAARIEKLRKLIKASLYYGDDIMVTAKHHRI